MADEVKKRLRVINIIGAAAVLGVLAGTVALGVMPLWRGGVKCINKSAELKAQIADLDALTLRVAKVQEEQQTRESRLAGAESKLPTIAAINQFVPDLAKVAEASGLVVDHVLPTKDVKDVGDYKLMTVEVTGKGDWDTCYSFLTGLRGYEHKLTRLDSLTLQVDREKGLGKPVCTLSVDISTFMAR